MLYVLCSIITAVWRFSRFLVVVPFVFVCRELPAPPPTGEWVEIVEPTSRKYIFANLTTGEICWTPPPGVKVYVIPVNSGFDLMLTTFVKV